MNPENSGPKPYPMAIPTRPEAFLRSPRLISGSRAPVCSASNEEVRAELQGGLSLSWRYV